jgi:hypothetical protein
VSSRTLRLGLLIVGFTVLLGLVAAEVGVRIIEPVPVADLLPLPFHHDDLRRLEAHDAYLRFDADLGWSQEPGVSRDDDGITYAANAAGFRADREYAQTPPPGAARLAAFGDSFIHCDEVNYADCWTARLESGWAGSEVLNFGIPGSAPDQGWLRYRRDGRPYQPCAVLIGYQIENVNRVVNRYRPFYSPSTGIALSKPRFVLDDTAGGADAGGLRLLPNPATSPAQLADARWVEETLGPGDFWYYPGLFAPGPLDNLMLVRIARSALYRQHLAAIRGTRTDERPNGSAYDPDDERFQVAGRVLVQFAREVQVAGSTPVVVVFGQRDEIVIARHRQPREYQPLLDWLAAEQIATVDITNDLAREANERGVDTMFARGGHYSRRANQVIGAALAQRLPRLTAATCG